MLDARARMQARDSANGTRFDEARQIAASYLRRASVRQPVALLVADAAPRVAAGLTDDEKSLLAALDATHPTDAGGRIEDAVALAGQLLAARPGAHRIVLVTDHAPLPSPGVPAGEIETRLVGTPGTPRENVGITRLAARPLPGSPETDEVFVEIENFGAQRQSGRVELTFEGRLLDVKPYDLAPGERRADVYPALAARTGLANARGWLTAHLDPTDKTADAFAPDDDAFASIPPPRPARVLLVTRGNWFLESLLKADEQITFDQLTPDIFQPAQAAGFDAVVLDDFLPPALGDLGALPPGNFLFLHRAPLPADPTELAHPFITDLDASSPLLRLVNLRDVTVLRAQAWTLPDSTPGGWRFNAPVRSLEHPLVVTGERGSATASRRWPSARRIPTCPCAWRFRCSCATPSAGSPGRDAAAETHRCHPRRGQHRARGGSVALAPPAACVFAPIDDVPAAEKISGPGVFQPMQNGFYLTNGRRRHPPLAGREHRRPRDVRVERACQRSLRRPSGQSLLEESSQWEAMRVWPPWVYLALGAFTVCALEWWGFHRRRTE